MVEIHLYGNLRHYDRKSGSKYEGITLLEPDQHETIASLLAQAGIPVDEIQHIFFNSKLLASRSKASSLMGFVQAQSISSDWDLRVPVQDGDRLGLFGTDMALVGM